MTLKIITVRLEEETLKRASALQERLDGSSITMGSTRTDVLRAAILEGLAVLERKVTR